MPPISAAKVPGLWLWRAELTVWYDQSCTKPHQFKGILKQQFCNIFTKRCRSSTPFQLLCNVQRAGTARVLSTEGPSPPAPGWGHQGWGGISMGREMGLSPFPGLKQAVRSFIVCVHMRKKPLGVLVPELDSLKAGPLLQSLRISLCACGCSYMFCICQYWYRLYKLLYRFI